MQLRFKYQTSFTLICFLSALRVTLWKIRPMESQTESADSVDLKVNWNERENQINLS